MATNKDEGIQPITGPPDQESDDVVRITPDVTLQTHDLFEDSPVSDDVLRVEAEHQEQVLDGIDKLDLSRIPHEVKSKINLPKIAAWYRKAKSIRILLTGKTGTGKSTLVNGIVGLKIKGKGAAKEGLSIKRSCTDKVTEYNTKIGSIDVTVWDTPGLQDGTDNQESYLHEMKEKCTPRDMTMYCIDVNTIRFVKGNDNPDVLAMKKLTETFGTDFWKNVVIVLTFANMLEHLKLWSSLPPKEKSRAFQSAIGEWKEQIQEILLSDALVPKEIVDTICVVPAGHYSQRQLPNCEYWLSALWFQCVSVIPSSEAKAALVKMNLHRIKRKEEVKEADFKRSSEQQPIVVPDSFDKKLYGSLVGGMTLGGAAGAGIGCLGLLGGPLIIITIPIGLGVGAAIGGGIGLGMAKAWQ